MGAKKCKLEAARLKLFLWSLEDVLNEETQVGELRWESVGGI